MKNEKLLGALILPVRLVISWLFLSAVHRRLILDPTKHDMESAGWIGHKINTFFPQANGYFRDILEYVSANPEAMHWFAWSFTLKELLLGLLLLIGLASRLTGLLLMAMSIGLMHSAGWLGPTCLDEWQIASLLLLGGGMLTIFGSGSYSLDSYLNRRFEKLNKHKYWGYLTQLDIIRDSRHFNKIVIAYSVSLLMYVMWSNQLLHGGVWGTLRNDSVQPNIVISDFRAESSTIYFTAFRDKGPETYGAFIMAINLYDSDGALIHHLNKSNSDSFRGIIKRNYYINQVTTNENSLVFPLGSKADIAIKLPDDLTTRLVGGSIEMSDISERKFLLKLDWDGATATSK